MQLMHTLLKQNMNTTKLLAMAEKWLQILGSPLYIYGAIPNTAKKGKSNMQLLSSLPEVSLYLNFTSYVCSLIAL